MKVKNTYEGRHLKLKRVELGLTQTQLSKKIKVHPQYVSNWERGKCPPPLAKYKKLVKLLKIDLNELLIELQTDYFNYAFKFINKLK